ncbi:MAG: hypothetical protein IJZ29_05365 [Clostridia bacterium]|nr:hypothetical protein [Clostridia bacterium]
MENKENISFDLIRSQEIYDNKVKFSYYFRSNKEREVRYKSVKVFDESLDCYNLMRFDTKTGELTEYSRSDCLKGFASVKSNAWRKISQLLDANNFDWFITLTFDNNVIDRTDDAQVYDVYMKWIRIVKNECPDVRYLTVVERHKDKQYNEKGCLHFHILMGNIRAKQLHLVDSGKVCCSWLSDGYAVCSKEYFEKTKEGRILTETDGIPVYNISNFYWGLTTVTKVQSQNKTKSYVKKYLKKEIGSTTVFKKNYFYSRNLERPVIKKDVIKTSCRISDISCYNDQYTNVALTDYYSAKYNVRQLELERCCYEMMNNGITPIIDVEIEETEIETKTRKIDGTLIPIDVDVSDIF